MVDERIVAIRRSIRRFANTTDELAALQVGVIIWSRAEGHGNRWAAFVKAQNRDSSGEEIPEWHSFRVRSEGAVDRGEVVYSVELGEVVYPVPVSLVLALHDRSRVKGWDPDRLSEDTLEEGMKSAQDSLTWTVNTQEEMDALPIGTVVRTATESHPTDPGTLIKLPYAARGLTYYMRSVWGNLPTDPNGDPSEPLWWLFSVTPDGKFDVIVPFRAVPPCVVLNWGNPEQ